jgi:SAM-dependent methyltransferase
MRRPRRDQVQTAAKSFAATARKHTRRRGWLEMPERPELTLAPKPAFLMPVYEELLGHLRRRPVKILELGIWGGDSLQMWRDGFPRARIVGVDLKPPDHDFGPRVTMLTGDQADADLMHRISHEHAPDGWDVIIDDASHLSIPTARSLKALYRDHLKPGGVYIIEDWGTGYWPFWWDGGDLAEPISVERLDHGTEELDFDKRTPIPLPSHDYGMAGLVKRLVDHVIAANIDATSPHLVDSYLPIDSLRVFPFLVALTKSA